MPLKSDPRRLPRRNHYQEGPDFLFVATQGGRPMAAEPVRSPAAVVRGRARTIRLWAEGTSISEACTAGRCSRAILLVRMLSYWNSRRIAAEFNRRGIAVSHGQVDRLLARSGTNRTSAPVG